MATSSAALLCAGFYLGHPGAGGQPAKDARLLPLLTQLRAPARFVPPDAFVDLDGALAAGRLIGCAEIHGLWFTAATAAVLLRECDDATVAAVLRRGRRGPPPAAVAAGFDVLGIGGALCLPWTREDAGQALARDLHLPLAPPPFLPDARAAAALARELDADTLCAPVLWVHCWRTVHAPSA